MGNKEASRGQAREELPVSEEPQVRSPLDKFKQRYRGAGAAETGADIPFRPSDPISAFVQPEESPEPQPAAATQLPKPTAPAGPQTITYAPGQYVFREEEHSFELFILEEGTVEVFISDEKVTELSEPGTYLGEIGALLKRPRAASVRAKTACRFTIYADFKTLYQVDPSFLLKISRTLAQRVVDMNERVDRIWGVLYKAGVDESVIDAVQAAVRGEKVISVPKAKKGFRLF
jgi:hypothetical protein